MKKTSAFLFSAATAALLSWASPAMAGTFTNVSDPTFMPEGSFTNNTITLSTTIGEGALAHLDGSATVTPSDPVSQASIEISGDFSANAGDRFSIAYSFTADLNIDTSVTYTIMGTATPTVGPPVPFSATGTLMPGLHKYEGTSAAPASPIAVAGSFTGSLVLDFGLARAPLAAAPGTLDLVIQQIDFKLDPIVATVPTASQSQNISTRANVGTDDHVLIGGFIIDGTDSKMVVLRAIGPSLSTSGVTNPLADPTIELHDSTGAIVDTNDNWMDLSASDQTLLTDSMLAPTDDAESALVQTLAPGSYTAIVRGVNSTTGVALVEAYDIDNGTTDSKLANISTRGFVETGDNVMIGGFILGGGGGGFSTVVVRGIGPSLSNAGVTDALADPTLDLFDGDGNLIDSNDNWMDDANMQQVSDAGLAPSDSSESALYEILPAGSYTAILSGVSDTSGVGLVESYNLD